MYKVLAVSSILKSTCTIIAVSDMIFRKHKLYWKTEKALLLWLTHSMFIESNGEETGIITFKIIELHLVQHIYA